MCEWPYDRTVVVKMLLSGTVKYGVVIVAEAAAVLMG